MIGPPTGTVTDGGGSAANNRAGYSTSRVEVLSGTGVGANSNPSGNGNGNGNGSASYKASSASASCKSCKYPSLIAKPGRAFVTFEKDLTTTSRDWYDR